MVSIINWVSRKFTQGLRLEVSQSITEIEQELDKLKADNRYEHLEKNIAELTQSVSVHLNAVDSLAKSTHQIVLDLSERLEKTNNFSLGTSIQLVDIAQRLDELSLESQIQSSRIRAVPYSTGMNQIQSRHDHRHTFGFEDQNESAYIEFADLFRPRFEVLLEQLAYLKTWLPTRGIGIDLGAGRGEMVFLMSSTGISAYGVDSDQSMVDEAGKRGIDVRLSSIDELFDSLNDSSVSVLTAIQVVEHVDTPVLENWFAQAHRVLETGGVFIAETPNPHAIDAFKAFWIDVTHVRPYYPESLLYMAQVAGFKRAEIWVDGESDSVIERLGIAGSYTIIATK